MTNEDMEDDESEANSDRLFGEIAELFIGEQIIDSLHAIEKVVISLVTINCINKASADEVVTTMANNIRSMVDSMDALGLASWNEKDMRN
jgi:hypothetical protein